MQTLFFSLLIAKNYALFILAGILLVYFVTRKAHQSVFTVIVWIAGFIVTSGLSLIAFIVTVIGFGIAGTEQMGGLLLIPAVPTLFIFGLCSFFLWRFRPKEGLNLPRIIGTIVGICLLVAGVGAWLNNVHSKTVTFEIVDSANRRINGASISIKRETWILSGLVPARHYNLHTDNAGRATLHTWDFEELEAVVKSSSGSVTVDIKRNETSKGHFTVKHAWHTDLIKVSSEVTTFIPLTYPLHITSYVMPENEFQSNALFEDGYRDLISNPDQIFSQWRNLPFSLLLLRNEALLDNTPLKQCPQTFSEPCTLSEYFSREILDTYIKLEDSLKGLKNKIAAKELAPILDNYAINAVLLKNELDNMKNKLAQDVIQKELGTNPRIYDGSVREVLTHLKHDGLEPTPIELQCLTLGERILGLEQLDSGNWQEAAMRLIPIVETKIAMWKGKEKALDERLRILRESKWQQESKIK